MIRTKSSRHRTSYFSYETWRSLFLLLSLSLGICKIKRGTAWNGVLNTVTRFYKFHLKWNHTCDNRVYYFAEREMIARKGKKRNVGKPYTVLEHGLLVSKNFFFERTNSREFIQIPNLSLIIVNTSFPSPCNLSRFHFALEKRSTIFRRIFVAIDLYARIYSIRLINA